MCNIDGYNKIAYQLKFWTTSWTWILIQCVWVCAFSRTWTWTQTKNNFSLQTTLFLFHSVCVFPALRHGQRSGPGGDGGAGTEGARWDVRGGFSSRSLSEHEEERHAHRESPTLGLQTK